MTSIVFTCPTTETNVQAQVHEGEHAENFTYVIVECPACSGSHLINKATGKPLAEQALNRAKDQ